MAEKTIKTRIQLKYDSWDNWQKTTEAGKGGNLVLKRGEMAVTAISSGESNFTTPPTIMFKVGDGTHKFSELPWASGLAADVYSWAKAENKPTYTASEVGAATTQDISNAIASIPTVTDTDTQYRLTLSGHTLKLQSKAKGATSWSDVSGQSFTLPDNNTTYTFAEGTTNGAFTVTPSGGSAQSVKIHGLGTAAYKADTYFATADSVSDIQATIEGAVEAGVADLDATISGMAASKTIKTLTQTDGKIAATFQDISIAQSQVSGLTTALNGKQATLAFEGTYNASTNKVATKSYVDGKVVGAVQYLGTVDNTTELAALTPDSVGDFCRVSTAFGSYHVGDLLLCKTLKTSSAAATWDVVHGEVDKNTWTKNTVSADGYVTKGTGQANKVWKTDADGNPAWRDDANTDTKVTSAANHYAPAADASAVLTADAAGGSNATWNTTQLVTGVNLQRDAKGHVTGVTVDSVKMPANPNTDNNQKVKAKNSGGTDVTFGNNDVVEIAAGSNVTITPDATNKKITIASSYTDTNTAHSHTKGVGLIVTGNGGTSGSVEYKAALASETLDINAAVSRPAANANRTYPVIADKNGKLATIVPWTDSNTVTTVSTTANKGLKVTKTNNDYKVDIDDAVTFVFDCGSSTENI